MGGRSRYSKEEETGYSVMKGKGEIKTGELNGDGRSLVRKECGEK